MTTYISPSLFIILLFAFGVMYVLVKTSADTKGKAKKSESDKLLHWNELLKRHHVSELEYDQLLLDMKSIKKVPDIPKYWGSCKTIYYSALNSEELTLEQKQLLYVEFYRLDVSHLPFPRLKEETT